LPLPLLAGAGLQALPIPSLRRAVRLDGGFSQSLLRAALLRVNAVSALPSPSVSCITWPPPSSRARLARAVLHCSGTGAAGVSALAAACGVRACSRVSNFLPAGGVSEYWVTPWASFHL
jgi:hypothetical protein